MEDKGVLGEILRRTAERIRTMRHDAPVKSLQKDGFYDRRPRDFRRAFSGRGPRIVAEVKFASPSRGRLVPGRPSAPEAVRVAGDYLRGGAAALSVLTEPASFAGDIEYLRAIRRAYPGAALLMKDFVVDPYQLQLARWAGADAVLLIAAALGRRLRKMIARAKALGLSALVEVHTERELVAAREAGATMIGVNCRDLKTLSTDLGVLYRLARCLRESRGAKAPRLTLVAESGISRRSELRRLAAAGYDGFLIGSAFMATGKPGASLRRLLSRAGAS